MVWPILLLASSASFGGGSVNDFVASVAKETGKNVIAAVAADFTLPALAYDSAKPNSFVTALDKTPLKYEIDSDLAFSDECYVGAHFKPIAPDMPDAATAID